MFAQSNPPTLAEAVQALKTAHVEDVLLPLLIQLIVIIITARLFALLFRRLKQSGVVGEIAAGLILGPSVLGRLEVFHSIFHPTIASIPNPELTDQLFRWIFTMLSQIGLLLLVFLVGLEFDFRHLRASGKSTFAIALAGIVLPFALGLAIAPVLLGAPELLNVDERASPPSGLAFGLFLGTALSITALPVLGRMMMELNIVRTRLGTIVITAAAVEDAVGWILLASVAAVARSAFDPWAAARMAGYTIAFVLFMIFVARPFLLPFAKRAGEKGLGASGLGILLCFVLLCGIVTNLIGIFAVFGAFICGVILSEETAFREAVSTRLHEFTSAFFVPIFFAYTGLRTEIQTLDSLHLWLLCGLVLAASIVGKWLACSLAARWTGFDKRESACVGVLMNARGMMELVVINIGYDLKIIPKSVYCMLVLMALVTTFMTTPLFLRLMRGTKAEPFVLESEMYGGTPK